MIIDRCSTTKSLDISRRPKKSNFSPSKRSSYKSKENKSKGKQKILSKSLSKPVLKERNQTLNRFHKRKLERLTLMAESGQLIFGGNKDELKQIDNFDFDKRKQILLTRSSIGSILRQSHKNSWEDLSNISSKQVKFKFPKLFLKKEEKEVDRIMDKKLTDFENISKSKGKFHSNYSNGILSPPNQLSNKNLASIRMNTFSDKSSGVYNFENDKIDKDNKSEVKDSIIDSNSSKISEKQVSSLAY